MRNEKNPQKSEFLDSLSPFLRLSEDINFCFSFLIVGDDDAFPSPCLMSVRCWS